MCVGARVFQLMHFKFKCARGAVTPRSSTSHGTLKEDTWGVRRKDLLQQGKFIPACLLYEWSAQGHQAMKMASSVEEGNKQKLQFPEKIDKIQKIFNFFKLKNYQRDLRAHFII